MIGKLLGFGGRFGGLRRHLARVHRDETGAQGLEVLLIVVAIVLPLLAVLIWFRNEIKEWVKDIWDKVRGESETIDVENPF